MANNDVFHCSFRRHLLLSLNLWISLSFTLKELFHAECVSITFCVHMGAWKRNSNSCLMIWLSALHLPSTLYWIGTLHCLWLPFVFLIYVDLYSSMSKHTHREVAFRTLFDWHCSYMNALTIECCHYQNPYMYFFFKVLDLILVHPPILSLSLKYCFTSRSCSCLLCVLIVSWATKSKLTSGHQIKSLQ